MPAIFTPLYRVTRDRTNARRPLFWIALLLVCSFVRPAAAQTTTIAGTVYDPRTTSSALPIPNVLVYVTTLAVPPLPSGVQCLTFAAPKDAVSFTYTAVDGTFTLDKVPQNTAYTIVIQAGKWRRQFAQNVAATPVTGLQLHMPANHKQGDIPLIAVDTGGVDGVECVLHTMGIDDSEFTDDNGKTNPGGRIHLYQGAGNPGAVIDSLTPKEDALTSDSALLSTYDVVMFPCQGSNSYLKSPAALKNLVDYANTGGRVFATHFSYVWLDPDAPFNSQFPAVVKWNTPQNAPPNGVGTINTGFTDGATLAQWLQNAGASYNNQEGQISIYTLRHDFDTVIPPTQAWLRDNSDNTIQQITFNTPVGAAASAQCGRVLFNEYHVIDESPRGSTGDSGMTYPSECPAGSSMTAQEEMLEYALFDLSAFVQPVVVPTLDIKFNPDPMVVKQNDPSDQVTIAVTNTSTNTAIDPSAVLKISLPPVLTATALADSTGGWICTLSPLQCKRQSSIASATTDSVLLTVSVGAYGSGTPPTGGVKVTISSPTFSNDVVATDPIVFQQPPTITWATPAPIVYGTALSGTQLDASSPLPGKFVYSPDAGIVLPTGQHTLSVTFTPTDVRDYTPGTASVTLTVVPGVAAIGLSATPNPAFIQNPVQFTSSVKSSPTAPTGTVNFLDGTTMLGSGSISAGAATYTTSSLIVGTHNISAAYSGDALFKASTSSTLSVLLEDFKLDPSGPTAANNTVTIYPGQTALYALVLTPIGGPTMPADIALSVSGLPTHATYRFSRTTVTAGSGISPFELDVTPPSISSNLTPRSTFDRSLPIALGLLLLPFAKRARKMARRWQSFALVALTSAVMLWGAVGCGVTYTPKTYNLIITAKSGGLSHTTTVNLIVK